MALHLPQGYLLFVADFVAIFAAELWEIKASRPFQRLIRIVAEREGFEPSEPLRAQRFSRPPHSTTLPPLRTPSGGPRRRAGLVEARPLDQASALAKRLQTARQRPSSLATTPLNPT